MTKQESINRSRRGWLRNTGILSAGLMIPGTINAIIPKSNRKSKTILVVSGWQDVNIGDIAHTPGLLHILETFLPNARIILWKKSNATEEVKKLLSSNFPKVKVIYGNVDADKNIDNPEVYEAFRIADILVHGSGPSVVGQANLEAWVKHTEKPFGIFGVTIEKMTNDLKELLQKASFIYTRETASIKVLTKAGLTGNHISFAPDATFYLDIHDEDKADQFLKANGLRAKEFICVIPRLRRTPYYKIRSNSGWSEERIKETEELNDRCKERDHAKLREVMIAWVRETGNKVLVCPEMTYEVDIMDELLIDPLPEDVKPFVIKRGYWMPDEAASVYAKAHTVLSFECHSPIMAAANGTPMFYLRQPEDTIKGQMYYDLGFNDWIFEIEETEGKQIADRFREVWKGYEKAKNKLQVAMKKVDKIYENSASDIKKIMG
jgi:polysaccharide pyruvyl transferase WcaK-like protein